MAHVGTWRIRRGVQTRDLTSIAQCNERTLPENYPRSWYRWLFSAPSTCVYVAEATDANGNAEFTGYVICIVEQDKRRHVFGHVYSLSVYPQHRRRGIASALLAAAEMEMKQRYPSMRYLALHVRKTNRAAQNLYCKCAFHRATVVKQYYADNEDAYRMKKIL